MYFSRSETWQAELVLDQGLQKGARTPISAFSSVALCRDQGTVSEQHSLNRALYLSSRSQQGAQTLVTRAAQSVRSPFIAQAEQVEHVLMAQGSWLHLHVAAA